MHGNQFTIASRAYRGGRKGISAKVYADLTKRNDSWFILIVKFNVTRTIYDVGDLFEVVNKNCDFIRISSNFNINGYECVLNVHPHMPFSVGALLRKYSSKLSAYALNCWRYMYIIMGRWVTQETESVFPKRFSAYQALSKQGTMMFRDVNATLLKM